VITITGISDHVRLEWPITITGMRTADSGESPWHTVPNIIGFFTGVYALVRGWDNIITELRS
jgi:hypothetical protein